MSVLFLDSVGGWLESWPGQNAKQKSGKQPLNGMTEAHKATTLADGPGTRAGLGTGVRGQGSKACANSYDTLTLITQKEGAVWERTARND